MSVEWERFRLEDGTINLLDAWHQSHRMKFPGITNEELQLVKAYIKEVEDNQPINSRQAAGIVLANASDLITRHRNKEK